jgi:hypothetical protein
MDIFASISHLVFLLLWDLIEYRFLCALHILRKVTSLWYFLSRYLRLAELTPAFSS